MTPYAGAPKLLGSSTDCRDSKDAQSRRAQGRLTLQMRNPGKAGTRQSRPPVSELWLQLEACQGDRWRTSLTEALRHRHRTTHALTEGASLIADG